MYPRLVLAVVHAGHSKYDATSRSEQAERFARVTGVLDTFIHYAAETEAGSAGAPVLNDQWQLVGLHHARAPGPEGVLGSKWERREAIRVDSIVGALAANGYRELAAAVTGEAPVPPRGAAGRHRHYW
jgi:hypothetical protein